MIRKKKQFIYKNKAFLEAKKKAKVQGNLVIDKMSFMQGFRHGRRFQKELKEQ